MVSKSKQGNGLNLSVVIPTYNSAKFIEKTILEMQTYLKENICDYELIFIDDGSKDETVNILETYSKENPDIRLLKNIKNHGKGHAVRRGVLNAKGNYVIFTDSDLAYPPKEIGKIIDALKDGADVAIATRVASESRYILSPTFFSYLYTRHLGSRIFNFIVRKFLGLHIQDSQAGLKGFNKSIVNTLFKRQRLEGFVFDIELLFISKKFGLTAVEVPVLFQYFSESSTISFVKEIFRSLQDLLIIRLNNYRGKYN